MTNESLKTIIRLAVVLTLTGFSLPVHAQTIADMKNLTAKLLDGYNTNILPTNNHNEAFKIGIFAHLMDLGQLDEVNELLSTAMVFFMKWRDESMVWNVEDYNHITNITMHQNDVWMPRLRLRNMHFVTRDGPLEKDMEKVVFYSDGTATFTHFKILHSNCDLDTTKYPFDKQTCKLVMWISDYNEYSFHMDVLENDTLLGLENEDGAWDIISNTITGNHESEVVITYVLKRKPLYILLNVILPIATLVFLTPAVFLLPNDRGEQIGFAVSSLLTISVYMSIVGGLLPANSDPLPLLSIVLFVWYLMTGLNVFIVIINLKVNSRKSDSTVSATAKRFVKFCRYFRKRGPTTSTETCAFKSIRGCSCMRNVRTDDVDQSGKCSSNSGDAAAKENAKADCESDEHNGHSAVTDQCSNPALSPLCSTPKERITWQDVSKTIDAVAMMGLYSVDFLVTLVYILLCFVKD